jgi:hypothetical protein
VSFSFTDAKPPLLKATERKTFTLCHMRFFDITVSIHLPVLGKAKSAKKTIDRAQKKWAVFHELNW